MATLCAIGNDPIEPNRLSLNNGLQHAEFYVGPPVQSVNASPVTNIAEYLAKRKDGSEDFVTLKVLTLSAVGDSAEDRHGKVLLHNEMQVLSFLHDQSGVVHHYGLFKDRNLLILVLDCLQAHDYDVRGRYRDYINLQHYVIQEKRLGERDALELFFQLLITVDALHRVCVLIVLRGVHACKVSWRALCLCACGNRIPVVRPFVHAHRLYACFIGLCVCVFMCACLCCTVAIPRQHVHVATYRCVRVSFRARVAICNSRVCINVMCASHG